MHTNQKRRTKIMGVLNVTPDSFSDGGKFNTIQNAVTQAQRLVREGADVVDIGGESSRPGSEPVSVEEELKRIIPVFEALEGSIAVPLSIDTLKPEVAEAALKRGATIVNDISGLCNEKMREVVAQFNATAVIMHMQGVPKDMQLDPEYEDVVEDVKQFFKERIAKANEAGIRNIILDPGIGFGKTLNHNLTLLRCLDEFTELGYPILVGTSRKSFIGALTGDAPINDRLEGTLASVVLAAEYGATWVRVHDVREVDRALKVANAVSQLFE